MCIKIIESDRLGSLGWPMCGGGLFSLTGIFFFLFGFKFGFSFWMFVIPDGIKFCFTSDFLSHRWFSPRIFIFICFVIIYYYSLWFSRKIPIILAKYFIETQTLTSVSEIRLQDTPRIIKRYLSCNVYFSPNIHKAVWIYCCFFFILYTSVCVCVYVCNENNRFFFGQSHKTAVYVNKNRYIYRAYRCMHNKIYDKFWIIIKNVRFNE